MFGFPKFYEHHPAAEKAGFPQTMKGLESYPAIQNLTGVGVLIQPLIPDSHL